MQKTGILELKVLIKKAQNTIHKLKLSMMAHPDCVKGSEFDDYTTIAQDVEDELDAYLNDK
jgi:hypothetical protein